MFNNSKNLASSIYVMFISPDLMSLWVRGISLTAIQMSLVPAPIFSTKPPPLHTKSCISESLQKVSPCSVSPAGNASPLWTKHFPQTLLYWVWQAGQAALLCSVAQSRPTLCDSMECSSPGSSLHGIFQARILERDVISYSRASSQPRDWTHVSCISCIGRQILYCWATWEGKLCRSEAQEIESPVRVRR